MADNSVPPHLTAVQWANMTQDQRTVEKLMETHARLYMGTFQGVNITYAQALHVVRNQIANPNAHGSVLENILNVVNRPNGHRQPAQLPDQATGAGNAHALPGHPHQHFPLRFQPPAQQPQPHQQQAQAQVNIDGRPAPAQAGALNHQEAPYQADLLRADPGNANPPQVPLPGVAALPAQQQHLNNGVGAHLQPRQRQNYGNGPQYRPRTLFDAAAAAAAPGNANSRRDPSNIYRHFSELYVEPQAVDTIASSDRIDLANTIERPGIEIILDNPHVNPIHRAIIFATWCAGGTQDDVHTVSQTTVPPYYLYHTTATKPNPVSLGAYAPPGFDLRAIPHCALQDVINPFNRHLTTTANGQQGLTVDVHRVSREVYHFPILAEFLCPAHKNDKLDNPGITFRTVLAVLDHRFNIMVPFDDRTPNWVVTKEHKTVQGMSPDNLLYSEPNATVDLWFKLGARVINTANINLPFMADELGQRMGSKLFPVRHCPQPTQSSSRKKLELLAAYALIPSTHLKNTGSPTKRRRNT